MTDHIRAIYEAPMGVHNIDDVEQIKRLQEQLLAAEARIARLRGDIASYINMDQGEDAACAYLAKNTDNLQALAEHTQAVRKAALLEADKDEFRRMVGEE